MKKLNKADWITAAALLLATTVPAFAQGQGKAVVTVLPGKHSEIAPNISLQDLTLKVNGKECAIASWTPLRDANDRLEIVVLIDSAARNLNGSLLGEIGNFIEDLTPHTKVAVGYMENGNAVLTGPLSANHAQATRGLHLPQGHSNGPYFSLTDLAKNWPSAEQGVRREVLMVTGGVDPFNRHYDPEDPYLQAAIDDSARAGLVVYSIYWRGGSNSSGFSSASQSMDGNRNGMGGNRGGASAITSEDGESLLQALTQATGGKSYWIGTDNPVTFHPYLADLALRLKNQYEMDFSARLNDKPAVQNMKLKARVFAAEVDAPERVYVDHGAMDPARKN